MIDRSEVNRALAKALAFKQCGDDESARRWACVLIEQLELAEILSPEGIRRLAPAYRPATSAGMRK